MLNSNPLLLLIEDSETDAKLFRLSLLRQASQQGLEIEFVRVATIKQACKWLQESKEEGRLPTLICLDPGLPGVNEFNLERVIQKLSFYFGGDRTRIVGLTGSDEGSHIWKMLKIALGQDQFDSQRLFGKQEALRDSESILNVLQQLVARDSTSTGRINSRDLMRLDSKFAVLESQFQQNSKTLDELGHRINVLDRILRQGSPGKESIGEMAYSANARSLQAIKISALCQQNLKKELEKMKATLKEDIASVLDGRDAKRIEQRTQFFYQIGGRVAVAGISVMVLSILNFFGFNADALITIYKALSGGS